MTGEGQRGYSSKTHRPAGASQVPEAQRSGGSCGSRRQLGRLWVYSLATSEAWLDQEPMQTWPATSEPASDATGWPRGDST